jgi:DNA-binding beta-propeller fold protein YncE
MRTRLLRRTIAALLGVPGLLAPAPCHGQPLLRPSSVALDSASNLYVTELERHTVKIFDASGVFLVEWGARGAANAQFEFPLGIAVDAGRNAVYVADSGNQRIQKFTTKGVFVSAWGTFGNQPGEFRRPTAIAVDAAGNVLVTDSDTKRVQVFTSTGTFVRAWGGLVGAGDGQFATQGPQGIAVDAGGNVLVVDRGNNRIMQFDPTGVFLGWGGKCTGGSSCTNFGDPSKGRSVGFTCTQMLCSPGPLGNGGEGDGQFMSPTGLSATSDGVYVTDASNRIQFLNAQGFQRKWGSTGSGSGQLKSPLGVAAAGAGASVYVADAGNNRIQRFDATGLPQTAWGGADIRLNASDGAAPGGSVNPILLAGMSMKSSTITVTSLNGFAGPVDLSVSCCGALDELFGRSAETVATLSAAQVMVPANGSATARLDLSRPTALGSPDKWLAVVTATNTALSVRQVQGVVFTVAQQPGADFILAAAPGRSPGIRDLFPTGTATSVITVASTGPFDGRVSLAATSCLDVISGKTVALSGATFSPQSVDMRLTSEDRSTLTMTMAAPPVFGKCLASVTGTHPEIGTRSATVGFTVLPPAIAGPTTCRPSSLLTVSMRDAVKALIQSRERASPGPDILIGLKSIAAPQSSLRWTITVAADPLLQDGEAMIVLDNQTGDDKEITTAGCGSRSISTLAPKGRTTSMIIRPLTERTIVFRQKIGPHFPPNQRTWQDVFVMSETAFWLVFGGRRTTFTWLQ